MAAGKRLKKEKERTAGRPLQVKTLGTSEGGGVNSTTLAAQFKVASVSGFIRRADSPLQPSFL